MLLKRATPRSKNDQQRQEEQCLLKTKNKDATEQQPMPSCNLYLLDTLYLVFLENTIGKFMDSSRDANVTMRLVKGNEVRMGHSVFQS